ncbi:MAG: leucine-rich repeat protein [Eubacteriales bacterium]
MGYVAARCPNCAGDLQLDDKMEKGYCTHCGTPIYFKDAVQKVKIVGPVEVAGMAKLESLIKLIKKDLEFGMNQTAEFRDRLNRALELDPNNQYLYDLQSSEVWNAKIVDGELKEFKSSAKKIVVPDCVTTISRFAFKSSHMLTDIVLPRSIKMIAENAFYKEERLTIHAYKNTYAARFALVSPAFLQIIDDDENHQEHIRKIEEILTEIVVFKNLVVNNIKRHYDNKIFAKVLLPYIFVILLAIFYITSKRYISHNSIMATIILTVMFFISFILLIFSRGYLHTCRKIAKKNQIVRFYKKSNDLLSPFGITDFKYLKNIWECSNTNLEYEARRLEEVKKKILQIDYRQYLKNPYIHLSFLSYITGERPQGLDDY